MAAGRLARTPSKRWVQDDEVAQCPLCTNRFEGNFLDITLSGRTHCRYCGGVFCTSCCKDELYMPEDEVGNSTETGKTVLRERKPCAGRGLNSGSLGDGGASITREEMKSTYMAFRHVAAIIQVRCSNGCPCPLAHGACASCSSPIG